MIQRLTRLPLLWQLRFHQQEITCSMSSTASLTYAKTAHVIYAFKRYSSILRYEVTHKSLFKGSRCFYLIWKCSQGCKSSSILSNFLKALKLSKRSKPAIPESGMLSGEYSWQKQKSWSTSIKECYCICLPWERKIICFYRIWDSSCPTLCLT